MVSTPKVGTWTHEELVEACRDMMRGGSLSFFLASKFLPKSKRSDVFLLYGWCRHCDDVIDSASHLGRVEQLRRLQDLKKKTEAALRGEPGTDLVFAGFTWVCARYGIPSHYPLELLEGMRMDVEGHVYRTWEELRLYCYRVAGVVGLMMTHVLGVRDPGALRYACDLGSAMQMSNIARDVREDAQMGRLYLPEQWLKENPSMVDAVSRLLNHAEQHYRSGLQGLGSLTFRTSLAISAAASVYSEIGQLVKTRGKLAWHTRAVVPLRRKLWVIFRDLPAWLRSRIRAPRGPVKSIDTIWRFQ